MTYEHPHPAGYDDEQDDFRDHPGEPYEPWRVCEEERWYDGRRTVELQRLTHLVLVDGRLVETWTERVEGTRWMAYAERFDAQLHQELLRVQPQPQPPPYELLWTWLLDVCGDLDALEGLDEEPLSGAGLDLPAETPDERSRERLERAAELLDRVGRELLVAESASALRRALLLVWTEAPETLLIARSPAHLAASIVWVVGRANGLMHPNGGLTSGVVHDVLGSTPQLAPPGKQIERALRGFRPEATRSSSCGVPDLLAPGRVDLLTSTTRAKLVRLRDRARSQRDAAQTA